MKIFSFFLSFFAFTVMVLGAKTTSSSSSSSTSSTSSKSTTSQTTVWHTVTSAGKVYTTKSIFSQTFMSTPSVVSSVSSGKIGLGSLSGTVGGHRSYEQTTISRNDGNFGKYAGGSALSIGVFMILNCLL